MGTVKGSLEASDYGFIIITIYFMVFFPSNCQMCKCESLTVGLIPG